MRKHLDNRLRIACLLKSLAYIRICIDCCSFLAKANADAGNNEKAMYYDSEYDYYKKTHAHILDEIKKLRR